MNHEIRMAMEEIKEIQGQKEIIGKLIRIAELVKKIGCPAPNALIDDLPILKDRYEFLSLLCECGLEAIKEENVDVGKLQ